MCGTWNPSTCRMLCASSNRIGKLPLSGLLIFMSVSRLVQLYPSVAINLSNAACPSSLHLYTPASSRTSMNTWPISFWMISWMLSAFTFS